MEDINKTLEEAIGNKDIKSIRNILTTSMVQDPGFNNGVFEERLKRCLVSGLTEKDLFESFGGTAINTDSSAWTKDYYAAQRTEFRYNFSLERLEHLKMVGRKLYPSVLSSASLYDEKAGKKSRNGETYAGGRTYPRQESDFPKWLIPVGIGAAAIAILLFVLLG
jgi:hypothetical protein